MLNKVKLLNFFDNTLAFLNIFTTFALAHN